VKLNVEVQTYLVTYILIGGALFSIEFMLTLHSWRT